MTRFAAILLALLLWPAVALAEPHTMTQNEFETLITGNTIVGDWAGRSYRQFFEEGGKTLYQEKDSDVTHGTWRVTDEGQYCSVWPPSPKEDCYNVQRDGDKLLWDGGEAKVYPADVVPGKQMDW